MQAFKFLNDLSSGLRFRLLLMVAVACAPLVFVTLPTAWADRRRAKESWQQRSDQVLEVARREEQKIITETRQLLLIIAESAPVRNGNRRGCKELVDKVFLFDSNQRYANLGVTS